MIALTEINENNYIDVCSLQVAEDQKAYVANPMRILASAYAMQSQNARVWAVTHGEIVVGVLMVKDLLDEPKCYTLEQFLIDYRYQGQWFGRQALNLIIELLAKEKNYDAIEICVKMGAKHAVDLYKKAGFLDTAYIDPSTPDSYVLRYTFAD